MDRPVASPSEIVAELAEILGKKLTAYIGGVKDTRVIERWMQGGVEPYRDADQRVRLAYQIAKTLSEHDSAPRCPGVVHGPQSGVAGPHAHSVAEGGRR